MLVKKFSLFLTVLFFLVCPRLGKLLFLFKIFNIAGKQTKWNYYFSKNKVWMFQMGFVPYSKDPLQKKKTDVRVWWIPWWHKPPKPCRGNFFLTSLSETDVMVWWGAWRAHPMKYTTHPQECKNIQNFYLKN